MYTPKLRVAMEHNPSPTGRGMSGANASAIARSDKEIAGANASAIARSDKEIAGANASAIARSDKETARGGRRVRVEVTTNFKSGLARLC